jgi:hypothetical protein
VPSAIYLSVVMILHLQPSSVRVGLAGRDQLVRRSASRSGEGRAVVPRPSLAHRIGAFRCAPGPRGDSCRYNTKRDVRGHVWCDWFCGVYNGRECQFDWWDHKRDSLSRACR